MSQNANAIIALCSHIDTGEGIQPLEPREYNCLVQRLREAGKAPGDLFEFSADDFTAALCCDPMQAQRLMRLIDRWPGLRLVLEQYRSWGIEVVTGADTLYPRALKDKLADGCPPLFYYAGDLALSMGDLVGYVGARTISQEDLDFTVRTVRKTVNHGFGVVSGGARGVDTVAGREALNRGGVSVEYLPGELLNKLNQRDILSHIRQGRLLLLSAAEPDAGFSTGMAMLRNRLIYAQSVGTVVVRAARNKGGTWAGANDNLKHGWSATLCWDHPYPGNQALIQRGAIPIDDQWDGHIPRQPSKLCREDRYEQTSFFEKDS